MWAFFYFPIGIHHSGTAMLRHETAQRLSHRSVSRFVFFNVSVKYIYTFA